QTVQWRSGSGTLCSTLTVGTWALVSARARRVFCCASGVAGGSVLMRGSLDFSLREPSTAFFNCAFSCSSFARQFARSVTRSFRTQSWALGGTTLDHLLFQVWVYGAR